MKLLGKEVKVGVRVRTVYTTGTLIHINQDRDVEYPFRIKPDGPTGEEYTVTPNGEYAIGFYGHAYDVVEVLDGEPKRASDAQFAAMEQTATELELENYRLTLENELLAQEVQELREGNAFLNKRIDRLEAELAAFAASRDVWKELAEKYERILKGHPASSSPKGGS